MLATKFCLEHNVCPYLINANCHPDQLCRRNTCGIPTFLMEWLIDISSYSQQKMKPLFRDELVLSPDRPLPLAMIRAE